MRSTFVAACAALLAACGGGEITEAKCLDQFDLQPAAAAKVDGSDVVPALSTFESGLLADYVTDIREGVRPFTDDAVGVCSGQTKECKEFLGTAPGQLEEGLYMLRGEFRVPRVGERGTWKVKLETECTIVKQTAAGPKEVVDTREREFDVVYTGEKRGYRLSPMVRIHSPSPRGDESCSYRIVSPHPGGDKEIAGSWKVPGKPPA